MARTSIPMDVSTRNELDRIKSSSETWDEFLLRMAQEYAEHD